MNDETDTLTTWGRFRASKYLAGVAILVALIMDTMTISLVQSLAPALIRANDYDRVNKSEASWMSENGDNVTSGGVRVKRLLPNGWKMTSFHIRSLGTTDAIGSETDEGFVYCEKGTTRCISGRDILQDIAPTVGYLNAVGPATELLVNPFVGIICAKIGHRWPFLFGSVLQIAGSLQFLLATNTAMLFTARITCGAASTVCAISCFMLAAHVFTDANERAKFTAAVIASAYPMGAMLSYFIGNIGYSFLGPRLPFGMLLIMGLVDTILRLIITTTGDRDHIKESGHKQCGDGNTEVTETTHLTKSPKPLEGTYFAYITNGYFVLTVLMSFIAAFAFASVSSTAPNWVKNVLQARQWQLGVILGVSSIIHLITNIMCGAVVKKTTTWAFMFLSCMITTLALLTYPFTPNVWFTLLPETMVRVAYGIITGTATSFVCMIVEIVFDGETAKPFALFVASYTLGFATGPFLGGLLLQYLSFMALYYSICPFVFLVGLGAFYLKTLK